MHVYQRVRQVLVTKGWDMKGVEWWVLDPSKEKKIA